MTSQDMICHDSAFMLCQVIKYDKKCGETIRDVWDQVKAVGSIQTPAVRAEA